jgi:hypothetical protein
MAAAAVVLACVPAGVLLAQTTPDTGTGTAATPAPAAAPAATPAPTETPAPAAATPPAAATTEQPAGAKKKKAAKMTRQQEIDKSIDSGTVPSRYRKQVPKEYQQYVPFAK